MKHLKIIETKQQKIKKIDERVEQLLKEKEQLLQDIQEEQMAALETRMSETSLTFAEVMALIKEFNPKEMGQSHEEK